MLGLIEAVLFFYHPHHTFWLRNENVFNIARISGGLLKLDKLECIGVYILFKISSCLCLLSSVHAVIFLTKFRDLVSRHQLA